MAYYVKGVKIMEVSDTATLYGAECFAQEIGAARDSFGGEYDITILEAAESVEMRIYDALCALRNGEEVPDTENTLIQDASDAWDALNQKYGNLEAMPGNPADVFDAREKWIVDRAGTIA